MREIAGAIVGIVVGFALTQHLAGAVVGAAIGAWILSVTRGGPNIRSSDVPPPWWNEWNNR